MFDPRLGGYFWVNPYPTPAATSELGDPVVEALAGLEVGGEVAADPGRDPPGTNTMGPAGCGRDYRWPAPSSSSGSRR